MIFNPTNSRRERFRARRAIQDAERTATTEREYIERLEALCVKPLNRNVNASVYDRAHAFEVVGKVVYDPTTGILA